MSVMLVFILGRFEVGRLHFVNNALNETRF